MPNHFTDSLMERQNMQQFKNKLNSEYETSAATLESTSTLSDRKVIELSLDPSNWVDRDLLLTIKQRVDNDETFLEALTYAHAKKGIREKSVCC